MLQQHWVHDPARVPVRFCRQFIHLCPLAAQSIQGGCRWLTGVCYTGRWELELEQYNGTLTIRLVGSLLGARLPKVLPRVAALPATCPSSSSSHSSSFSLSTATFTGILDVWGYGQRHSLRGTTEGCRWGRDLIQGSPSPSPQSWKKTGGCRWGRDLSVLEEDGRM